MCRDLSKVPPEEAAMMLAGILTEKLGVEVPSMKLYDAIRTKWSIISTLAHAIHDGTKAAPAGLAEDARTGKLLP
jgi:hypothetical protein